MRHLLLTLAIGFATLLTHAAPATADSADARAKKIADAQHAALAWLADHQSADGSWSADKHAAAGAAHGRTGSYDNPTGTKDTGWADVETTATGLATLALIANGSTHQDGEFKDAVASALAWIRAHQDAEGCVGSRASTNFVTGHAMSALVLIECYARSGDDDLAQPAQDAIDFIEAAQNEDADGYNGWRYGVRPGDNDLQVSGWCAYALRAAQISGLDVDPERFDGVHRLLGYLTTESDGKVVTGYITPGGTSGRLMAARDYPPNAEMDGCNVFLRCFLAPDARPVAESSAIQRQLPRFLDDCPPAAEPVTLRDFYFWHAASLALAFVAGDANKTWEPKMMSVLLDLQCDDEDNTATLGSWDPLGAWGTAGGRVVTTALASLTLATRERHRDMFGRQLIHTAVHALAVITAKMQDRELAEATLALRAAAGMTVPEGLRDEHTTRLAELADQLVEQEDALWRAWDAHVAGDTKLEKSLEELRKGIDYENEDKFPKAAEEYEDIVDDYDEDVQARIFAAQRLEQLINHPVHGEAVCDELAGSKPKSLWKKVERHLKREEWDEARELIDEIIADFPRTSYARMGRQALAELENGR